MSYQASSFSSQSSTTRIGNQPPQTHGYTERTTTDDAGTSVHRTMKEPGKATTTENFHIPSGQQVQGQQQTGRIEDVTDADRQYEERMEDEYAKREGGA